MTQCTRCADGTPRGEGLVVALPAQCLWFRCGSAVHLWPELLEVLYRLLVPLPMLLGPSAGQCPLYTGGSLLR